MKKLITLIILLLSVSMLINCSEKEEEKTALVRLVNNSTMDIEVFHYRESGTTAWGENLIEGNNYVTPGNSRDFTLTSCDKNLDFAAINITNKKGVEFLDKRVNCDKKIKLTVTD